MGMETELKLQVAPDAMQRLRRSPVVRQLKMARPLTRLERSVYFDTPEFELRRSALVLRVRHSGRRRIQTLKNFGQPIGVAWQRGEWEWEIDGDAPELPKLQALGLAAFRDSGTIFRRLTPIFTTEIRRSLYRLGDSDWEVELALDEGHLVAGEATQGVCEVELELKRGDTRRLFTLAEQLQKNVAARLSVTSKSARGYALAEGTTLTPRKAAAPRLAADCTVGEALREVARSCLFQLLANHDCLAASNDPEAVHQMRVALRRLRSAMKVFRGILDTPLTGQLVEELRWLQGPLGAARDADVFVAEILDPAAELLGDTPAYEALRNDFARRREAAYEAAFATLSSRRFTELMLRLGDWAEGGDWLESEAEGRHRLVAEPARHLAGATLAKRDKKVRKRMRRLAEVDDTTRHEIRIEVKKLRYAVDFFGSLYPHGKVQKLSSRLGAVQDLLGLMNDIVVSHRLLRDVAAASGDADRLWTAGMIAGWHGARKAELMEKSVDAWRAYKRLPRFWGDA